MKFGLSYKNCAFACAVLVEFPIRVRGCEQNDNSNKYIQCHSKHLII